MYSVAVMVWRRRARDGRGMTEPSVTSVCRSCEGRGWRFRPHLKKYVGEDVLALVFTGEKGALLRGGNFGRAVRWRAAVKVAGLPDGFHFHDLRHTGNNLAASTGASTRDLMHRMGHASMRAALIYQHANSERDREIAAGMDRRITRERPKGKKPAGEQPKARRRKAS
jgi:integrase